MNVSPNIGIIKVNDTIPEFYPGTLSFTKNSSLQIEAVPNPGHSFTGWSGDLSGSNNPATIVLDCNKSITANFSQVMHILTIEVKGNGSTNPSPGSHSYPEGSQVNLTAIPESGWQFVSWTGDVKNPDIAFTSLSINSNKTITCNFVQSEYTLTITSNGNGTTTPPAGSYSYKSGTKIDLTAVPDNNWQFTGWTGNVENPDSAATTITMNVNSSVAANFSPIMHTLMVETSHGGTTTPIEGMHNYPVGTTVNIKAVPNDGWRFDGWTGGVENPDSAVTTVTVGSNTTIKANFSQVKSSSRWLIIAIIASVIVIGVFIWLVLRRRIS